ncbi:tryptophan-rich sensory protein [Kordia sp. YSTF-M3]|uniref:Tryptophan-rich sensory protein n=1 Tax=Kordia aestuariivivens TaxID=2759037 RepID=A0ABR7Q660_9FLAO|nr:TspO/MBR family protein [Kordia aestuariivivens]MBC8754008.1 tryptophan-rich sensory protein [Kordia aestuariivivens]
MKFYIRLAIFLLINFGALGIGTILMDNGPRTDWYINLNQAPWTPQGIVFGIAWTTIMVCFSIYMAKLTEQKNLKTILALFAIQFVLNVSWNYVFFNQHFIALGMINLILLLVLVTLIAYNYKSQLKVYTLFILPYILWLIVACSLNGYILINN